ncbi:MAG: HEAT repeat domain-containing protein [Actinomycetota bacterium]|nr:HEAT repeat domain-containing protein [Actinomycetota bacterium]
MRRLHEVGHLDASARLRAVMATGDEAMLVRALSDTSPDVARAAIRRLVELAGPLAAPALRAVLLDADTAIVADLARALRDLGDPQVIAIATAGLAAEHYTRRLAAALTLGIVADALVVPDLCRALSDPIAAVRAAAGEALLRLGPDPRCADHAASLLDDPSPQVRVVAVRLVAINHPQPAALLAKASRDAEPEVRRELARHLGKLRPADADLLLTDPDEGVRSLAVLCAQPQHMPALARALTCDRRPGVRRAAASKLGLIGGHAAGEALLAALEDTDALVRLSALHALERALTREGTLERLTLELQSGRGQRRRAALYALARLRAAGQLMPASGGRPGSGEPSGMLGSSQMEP